MQINTITTRLSWYGRAVKIFNYLLLLSSCGLLLAMPMGVRAATDCAAQSSLLQSECEALLALYNSTNGPSWTNNTRWNTNDTPCSWTGITCSSGHIITITLWSNNLIGNLPPKLGNLTSLQKLHLGYNQLSGSLPPEWSQLVNLQWLYLHNNQLSGNLPPEWGQLASLQTLELSNNQLSGNLPPQWNQRSKIQGEFAQFSGFRYVSSRLRFIQ